MQDFERIDPSRLHGIILAGIRGIHDSYTPDINRQVPQIVDIRRGAVLATQMFMRRMDSVAVQPF